MYIYIILKINIIFVLDNKSNTIVLKDRQVLENIDFSLPSSSRENDMDAAEKSAFIARQAAIELSTVNSNLQSSGKVSSIRILDKAMFSIS